MLRVRVRMICPGRIRLRPLALGVAVQMRRAGDVGPRLVVLGVGTSMRHVRCVSIRAVGPVSMGCARAAKVMLRDRVGVAAVVAGRVQVDDDVLDARHVVQQFVPHVLGDVVPVTYGKVAGHVHVQLDGHLMPKPPRADVVYARHAGYT